MVDTNRSERRRLFRLASSLVSVLPLVALAFALTPPVHAANFVVNDTADEVDASPGDSACATATGTCTLRAAVVEANALPGADTIALPPGTYTLTLAGPLEDDAATGDLDVRDDLTVNGSSDAFTIVTAASGLDDRLFHVHAGVTAAFSDLTMRGGQPLGSDRGGGAIRADSESVLSIVECTLAENAIIPDPWGGFGGAVDVALGRQATLVDTRVIANRAAIGAGIFVDATALTLRNVTVSGNVGGAALESFGAPTSLLDIRDSTFVGNTGDGYGGAIYLFDAVGTVSRVVVEGNVAARGGGIALWGSCCNPAGIVLEDSIIRNNAARSADPFLGDGGGVYILGCPVRVSRCTIEGNSADTYSGGLGLHACPGAVLVEDTAIVGNVAQDGGGVGLWYESDGGRLLNCTVSGNIARGGGGGIYLYQRWLELWNVTVAGNVALGGPGGGIWNDAADVWRPELANSIVSGNVAAGPGPDCAGPIASLGHVLVGDPSGCDVQGDLTGVLVGLDARLGPLAQNGGRTATHALLAGSPALDGGNPSGCVDQSGVAILRDQRGVSRPADADGDGMFRCDMGAYEHEPGAGLAIQRAITLTAAGPQPALATVFEPDCRARYWGLCPQATVPGALEGLRLPGEALAAGTAVLWLYEHSDPVQVMTLERQGLDVVFHGP